MIIDLDIEIGDTVFKDHHKFKVEEIDITISENSYNVVETTIRVKLRDSDNYTKYVGRKEIRTVKEYTALLNDILKDLEE